MRRTVSVLILSGVIATTGVLGGVSVPGGRTQTLAAAPDLTTGCEMPALEPVLPFPGEYLAELTSGSPAEIRTLAGSVYVLLAYGKVKLTVTRDKMIATGGKMTVKRTLRSSGVEGSSVLPGSTLTTTLTVTGTDHAMSSKNPKLYAHTHEVRTTHHLQGPPQGPQTFSNDDGDFVFEPVVHISFSFPIFLIYSGWAGLFRNTILIP